MMRSARLVTAVLTAAGVMGALGQAHSQNVASTDAGAIRWEKSLAAARGRAQREKKPLLLMHLFGRLDEPFC
jgi:hypothetical protein